MSPEDFSDSPKHNHPEVVSNPEAAQRAEQVTLRRLLDIINDKTKHKQYIDPVMGKGADLCRPGESRGAASVWELEKGSDKYNPEKVGHITRSERVGDETIRINYFILDTPDGLHIEKHSNSSKSLPLMLPGSISHEELLQMTLDGIKRAEESIAAHAVEDELGLSFVSEQEVQELVTFLEPLDVHGIH